MNMKVNLVFGDPRSPERRLVLSQPAVPEQLLIEGVAARVQIAGQTFEGGLLGIDGSSGANPSYVSILLSEALPAAAVTKALLAVGWTETTKLPKPDHLPFVVNTTLVVGDPSLNEVWSRSLWFPHAFVPTQRTHLRAGSGAPVDVRCLAMTLRRDSAHQAVFHAGHIPEGELSLQADGWRRVPAGEERWIDLQAIAQGVEATVTYVLGATVVDGAILHDPEVLAGRDFARLLPVDVVDEIVLALQESGREDLIPPFLHEPD
jgi:hypothetical protein